MAEALTTSPRGTVGATSLEGAGNSYCELVLGAETRCLVSSGAGVYRSGDLVLFAPADQVQLAERRALARRWDVRPESTDGELLLAGWRMLGERLPAALGGDFAFAIWDRRRQLLFCVRDSAGARDLCYSFDDDRFLVASSSIRLVETAGVPGDLDGYYFADFLSGVRENRVRTPFAKVQRLLPGHALSVCGRSGKVEAWRWWAPPTIPDEQLGQEDAVDRFRSSLFDAVEGRLAVPGRAAIALSGGLDSASLAVVAGELARRGRIPPPLLLHETFSKTAACDERRWARPVARASQLELLELDNDELDYDLTDRTRDVAVGSPAQMHSALLDRRFAKLRQQGCSTVVNGFGGDNLFDAGRLQPADLISRGRWRELTPWVRGSMAAGRSAPRAVAAMALPHLLPSRAHRWLDRVRGTGLHWYVPDWLESDLARAARDRDGTRMLEASLPVIAESKVRQRSCENLLLPNRLGHGMEEWAHQAGLYGLSMSYPLLDRRLVEVVLSTQVEWLARPGPTGSKWLLRHAMEGLLPEEVRSRVGKASWKPYYDVKIGLADDQWQGLFRESRAQEVGLIDARLLLVDRAAYFKHPRGCRGGQLVRALLVERWLHSSNDGLAHVGFPVLAKWQLETSGQAGRIEPRQANSL